MKQLRRNPPTNICPLLAIGSSSIPAVCIEARCAWWDYLAGSCCMVSKADCLQAMLGALDELAQKEAPAGAASIDEDKETTQNH